MIERMPLSELIEDQGIYPRGSVSSVRVADYAYALDAGAQLPPPVADRGTRKIVDGFHRTRAWRQRLGEDGVIDVDMQDFDTELDMLLESARLNQPHGLPLGRYDQRVLTIRARRLGAADEAIAGALGVTRQRLVQITVRSANSDAGTVPLKRGAEHLASSYLTDAQVAALRSMRGGTARSKAAELTRLLREGIAPIRSDPDLRLSLAELADVIQEALAAFAE